VYTQETNVVTAKANINTHSMIETKCIWMIKVNTSPDFKHTFGYGSSKGEFEDVRDPDRSAGLKFADWVYRTGKKLTGRK
jgi:hypothetical protein